MEDVSQVFNKVLGRYQEYGAVRFWEDPERAGWLWKQGELFRNWRRRWFVLKDGKLFWFKTDAITPGVTPRGVVDINRCLSIKGAEDTINKPHALEISTADSSMYFIADTEKDKEDWINAVGRAIVRHSSSVMESEQVDYTAG